MGRWLVFLLAFALPVVVLPTSARSEAAMAEPVTQLSQTLRMPEALAILRDEAIANGRTLGGEAEGAAASFWAKALERIYDPSRMLRLFDEAFAKALAGDEATVLAATAFFAAEPGRQALMLELSAREAMLDEEVEAAAKLAYASLAADNPARQALIDRFVTVNDLVDSNVMGAMNANLAFLRGLAASGVKGASQSETDMLAEVWASEGETRTSMVDWVFPFLAMAYQPLSDEDLTAYIAFSERAEGKRLNAAIFTAYDAMLKALSFELGLAYGQSMQGDDI